MAAPAPGNCDDCTNVVAVMQDFQYPAHVLVPPVDDPAVHHCAGQHLLCQNTRANNECHPVPAGAPFLMGFPLTPNRTVCHTCDGQGRAMAMVDRYAPHPMFPPPAVFFIRGHQAVFHNDAAANNVARANGVAPFNLQLGAHHIGRLCDLCENTEIQRYWERRFGGARRGTAASAANTCKCEAFLNKRLCYQDRVNRLLDIQQASGDNAAYAAAWLRWLLYDPAVGRAKWATAGNALERGRIAGRRGPGTPNERNACRCGRDIPTAGRQRTSRIHPIRPNTPMPVAMCTACDGIIINVAHPRVSGWADTFPLPLTLPPNEQGNLKLRRRVEEV